MGYTIPLFDLNYGPEEEEAVVRVLRSRWISTGPVTEELERRFAAMVGAPHAVGVTNCTAALHMACRLLGLGEGDEVITPSLTFVATVNAIRYVGAVPVFCDIAGTDDLTLDPVRLERLVTERTRAVVVMHYAGFPCAMGRIMEIARRRRLGVIEDASHAPLSDCGGRALGTIGDIGCFSFFSNKNISTGEGGMLVTGNREYCERARLLRSHGMTSLSYERAMGHRTSYDVVDLGYNYRLDDIRAALGLVQLGRLREDIEDRAAVRRRYLDGLGGTEGLIIPFREHGGYVSNYIFPVVLDGSTRERRDRVRETLKARGIATSVHYPAVHRFSIYRHLPAELPLTEYAADCEITLPLYAGLGGEAQEHVIRSFKEALRGN
ncbi:MAG: DegT/DnrJ/EryC1/StrS family aminotransferase [bacterium]|nr:DegT/DnrJ/EryC1/StrS family aminotransferase [bacterium]